MADRLPQSFMLPPNFNPAGLVSPQLAHQAQHQQHMDNQQPQGIPSDRMWQLQQLQQQQAFRPQPGGNIPNGDGAQQMHDFLRSQGVARMQGQQPVQKQFGIPGAQMNGAGHDPNGNHMPPQMQPNFNGLGGNASQLQAAFRPNPSMMGPQVTRQLDLMTMAQQQQHQPPQGGPINMAHRVQPGMGAPAPNNFFGTPMLQGGDGAHPQQGQTGAMPGMASNPHLQQQHPQQPMNQGGARPAQPTPSPQQLVETARKISGQIQARENELQNLANNRASMPDNAYLSRAGQLQADIDRHKALLSKVQGAFASLRSQAALANQGMNNMGMNNVRSSPVPPPSQPQLMGQNPGWVPTPGQGFPGAPPRQNTPGQFRPSHPQSSPPPIHAQAPHLQQQPMPQNHGSMQPTQASPAMQSVPGTFQQLLTEPLNPALIARLGYPPPVEMNKFTSAYQTFCAQRKILHDERLTKIDHRPVDMYRLHSEVMREGGRDTVNQKDLWAVIGGRLGFVAFPGGGNEPAKCAPGAAQGLMACYDAYLLEFERAYLRTWITQKLKGVQRPGGGMQQPPQPPPGGTVTQMPGQPAKIRPDAQMMQLMIRHAYSSVEQMRNAGVNEQLIRWIEHSRPALQERMSQQESFRLAVGAHPAQQPVAQNGGFQPSNAGFGEGQNQLGDGQGNGHEVHPQQPGLGGMPNHQLAMQGATQVPRMPNQNQVQTAIQFVAKTKREYQQTRDPSRVSHITLPDEQRLEYNTIFEQLSRIVNDMDPKLPYYATLNHEQQTRRLVVMTMVVQHQRTLLSSATPKYMLDLNTVRGMLQQAQATKAAFDQQMASLQQRMGPPASRPPPAGQPPGQHLPIPQHPVQPHLQQHPVSQRQPTPQPQLPHIARPQQPQLSQPPPKKRLPSTSGPSGSNAVTPTASVATPPGPSTPANAHTPNTNQLTAPSPKSPKNKAASKPKPPQPKRKASNAKTTASPAVAAAETPKLPAAAAPSPDSNKRQREETVSGDQPAANSHSPKRVKTEWEGEPSLAATERQQKAAEATQSNEQAVAFLESATSEFTKISDGSQSLDFAETLDQILKAYDPDLSGLASSSAMTLDDARPPGTPPSGLVGFEEFFDFSSYDGAATAPTPDLVHSSSTNPSPASDQGSRSAGATPVIHNAVVEAKKHVDDFSDPLRLGAWGEIDGGESSYYMNSEGWSWEGPMLTVDQPWAISS